ncbi:MAG: DUF4012 domain-containing protein [Candidatus Doudnabacteria bacterium]|nr:DUF4012 domain-containing protein [Candidatus Doudnabacteria bacterium]
MGPLQRKASSHERYDVDRSIYLGKPARPLRRMKAFRNWRGILSFALISMLSVSVVYAAKYLSSGRSQAMEILGAATNAYEDLSQASKSLQSQRFDEAEAQFKSAQDDLSIAQEKFDPYRYLAMLVPQARDAEDVLEGAYLLSEAGRNLASALQFFDDLNLDSNGVNTPSFSQKLEDNLTYLSNSLQLLRSAKSKLSTISDLPVLDEIDKLTVVLQKLVDLEDLFLAFSGDGQKTYLLAFQNYDEARATGGFIGTYGVLKVEDGRIKNLAIDSVYDLDGRINSLIAAPGPFQPQIKRWAMRDANWFVDFSLSSKKLLYFLEQGQETADGVIAVTPKLFEDLLMLVGPIHMDTYGVTLTSANFQQVAQYKSSMDYDRQTNEPKKFLADFAPVLLNRLTNLRREDWYVLFEILYENLQNKQLLLYSKNEAVQDRVSKLNFGGQVMETDYDYLAIVNSNLGGTKTDLEIVQNAELATKIASDGTVINYLRLSRFNTAAEVNRNFVRILAPLGSELIFTEGIEQGPHLDSYSAGLSKDPDLNSWDWGELKWDRVFVRTESGKTEFSFWLNAVPAQKNEVLLVYRLPFEVKVGLLFNPTAAYSMLFQRQSGSKPYEFRHRVSTDLHSVWSTTNVLAGSDLSYSSMSSRDDYWAVMLKK